MPIPAGGIVTAGQLGRMQPVPYDAAATATLSGPTTSADVPGATKTFVTTAPNAVVTVVATFDFDPTGAVSGLSSGRLVVDGVAVGLYAVYQVAPGVAGERSAVTQSYPVKLPAAGSHTIKLVANLATGVNLNLYTGFIATVYEVV